MVYTDTFTGITLIPICPNIHLLFLGHYPPNNPPNSNGWVNGPEGLYVSQDGGNTWGTEILNTHNPNRGSPFGDKTFKNAPSMVTWWPSGKAFIANDTAGEGQASWWGLGPNDWGFSGLEPQVSLYHNVDYFSIWPSTPWSAMAIENGYETYCTSDHMMGNAGGSGDPYHLPPFNNAPFNPITPIPISYTNTTPSVLWRYDAAPDTSIPHNPNNDGNINNSTITLMAKVYYPAGPFMYLSGARGNTFPTDADYIFCSAWGGIRIPKKS